MATLCLVPINKLRSPLCVAIAGGVSWRKKVFYHRNIWNNLVSNIFAVEIHGFISQKYLKIINGPRPWVLLRAVDVDVAVGGGGEGGAQLLCRRQLGRAQHAVRRQRGGVQHRVVRVCVQQGGIWVHLLCLFLRRDLTTWFKWRRLLQRLRWLELGWKWHQRCLELVWKWCQRWLFCWLWCLDGCGDDWMSTLMVIPFNIRLWYPTNYEALTNYEANWI